MCHKIDYNCIVLFSDFSSSNVITKISNNFNWVFIIFLIIYRKLPVTTVTNFIIYLNYTSFNDFEGNGKIPFWHSNIWSISIFALRPLLHTSEDVKRHVWNEVYTPKCRLQSSVWSNHLPISSTAYGDINSNWQGTVHKVLYELVWLSSEMVFHY